EEHREEADRDGNPRDPRGATHAHQWTTRSVHSLIQSLRFAETVAGSIEYGCGGSTAHLVNTAGSFAPGTTGFTYIWSGMSSWNGSVIMKSRSACAPGTVRAPCNTPAYSIWWKHVDAITPPSGVSGCGLEPRTSAAGSEPYDTTIGRSPFAPPAVKSFW